MIDDISDFDFSKLPPVVAHCEKCGGGIFQVRKICSSCEYKEQRISSERSSAIYAARSSLPPRYRWATFDAPELPQRVRDAGAIAKAKAGAATFDRMVLLGPAGVGKTVIAAATLMERAREARQPGHFVDAHRLAIARAQSRLGDEALEVKEAIGADVLIVDDLGSERDIATSALLEVIHERHANLRPTIVTSWMNPEAIKQRYGDGLARRLFESALIVSVKPGRGT